MISSDIIQKEVFIFDMDGTLVNLENLNREGYKETIRNHTSTDLTDSDYQTYFSGTKTHKAFRSYLESRDESPTDDEIQVLVESFRDKKRALLHSDFDNNVKLIRGALEYLDYLKQNKKQVILATSTIKEFTETILAGSGLKKFFSYIITAEDIEEGKPSPDIYNLAISKSGSSKDTAVVFEDSKNGITSALSAEIYCIGIHTQGLNDEAIKMANFVIEDYFELFPTT